MFQCFNLPAIANTKIKTKAAQFNPAADQNTVDLF